jgi:hypothetical protein
MMEPHRINIPSRTSIHSSTVLAAGQIVVDALREAGINPRSKAAQSNAMLYALVGAWGRAEMTRERFIHACKNLLILNPTLGEERT